MSDLGDRLRKIVDEEPRDPNKAETFFSQASQEFDKGNYVKAAELSQVAYNYDPQVKYQRKKLSALFKAHEKGKASIDDVVEEFKNSIHLYPDNGHVHDELASLLSEKGEKRAAVNASRKAVEIEPGNSTFHHNLAFYLDKVYHEAEAIAEYEEAIRLEPDKFWSHYNLAMVFFSSKKYSRAIPSFRRAIEIKPDHANAHYFLGESLEKNGEDGERELRKAVQSDPDDGVNHWRLGLILERKKDPHGAIEEIRKAAKLVTDKKASYHYHLVNLFEGLGEMDEAIREGEIAEDLEPGKYYDLVKMLKYNKAEIIIKEADKYLEAGMYSRAIIAYEEILRSDPLNPDANLMKGACLYMIKQYDEAIRVLRSAEAPVDNLNYGLINLVLAYAYYRKNLFDEAYEFYQKYDRVEYIHRSNNARLKSWGITSNGKNFKNASMFPMMERISNLFSNE